MDTLREEFQEIKNRMQASIPDSKKLSKYKGFLEEIRSVEGVDDEAIDYITTSIGALEDASEKYHRIKEAISNPKESEPDPSRVYGCDVPKRFLTASKSDFKADLWGKCITASDGLYLAGKAGTGKTHLAVALLKEQLVAPPKMYFSKKNLTFSVRAKDPPLFVSVPELLMKIRDTYNDSLHSHTTEIDIMDELTGDFLLVLDDIGAEKTTDWSIQTLYTIIDRRYRDMQRTVFTSNLSLDELADKIGDRIASRIAGMCSVIVISGKDRRVKKP